MERKYKLVNLFWVIQLILPIVVVTIFQLTFVLESKIIIGHLLVIFCTNLSIIILGFLLDSKLLRPYQNTTKYVLSSFYGIFLILLYYTYLFAFLGKYFNSKIYTVQIILGYLKHINKLIDFFSVSPYLVYFGLFIIPLIIFTLVLYKSTFICQGFLVVKSFILKHNFNNPPNYIRANIIVFVFLSGFVVSKFFFMQTKVSDRLLTMEEPIFSFFFNNNPFQGHNMEGFNEDVVTRKAYRKNIEFQKKNIIIIVIDALRSDHLGLYGYDRKTSPFIDSLYSSGDLKKIELSFSAAAASFAGINSILRSRIWAQTGYNNFSIQQLLKDQGYEINFLLSGDHTNFYGLKSFYGKDSDFNYYIDASTTEKYVIADDRIIFEGLENIEVYDNNPSYFHFHLNSAHLMGIKQEKYEKFTPADAKKMNVENYTNYYDNGILQADDYVKEIFKILYSKKYLQNSIVILTSDHGEALGERGEFGHGKSVFTDQLLIPILIYDTDTVQYKNTKYATTLDIAPTIVDRLGLPIPETWKGNSLYTEEPREYTFHQIYEHYAIIHTTENSQFKYVYNRKTNKQEIYDLKNDLLETNNLIDSLNIEYVNSLRNKLSQFNLNP